MSQHDTIEKILNSLGICDEPKMHDTPANFILTNNEDGNARDQEWHYCSVIGQLNYLSGKTKTDIIFVVHQCKKYSIYPKKLQ